MDRTGKGTGMNNTNVVDITDQLGRAMHSGFFPRVFHIVDELMDRHNVLDDGPRFLDVFRALVEARINEIVLEEEELAVA
jgi:hypothetical protein